MKTIRILRSTGANLPRFTEGQEVSVDSETAELLCRLKLAEVLQAVPGEPLQGVPPEPEVQAEQKPRRKRKREPQE